MIYQGGSARIAVTFRDDAGQPADPGAGASISTRAPSGAVETYALDHANVSHPSTGVYVLDTPPCTERGLWAWQASKGGLAGAPIRIDAGTFVVLADPVGGRPEAAEAIQALRAMAQSAAYPTLSDAELAACLRGATVGDRWGRAADHSEWVPTYSLGRAARDAWVMKAGKVANAVNASDGGLNVSRSDLIAHCMTMADRYGARVVGSIPLSATGDDGNLPIFNVDDLVPIGAHDYVARGGAGGSVTPGAWGWPSW